MQTASVYVNRWQTAHRLLLAHALAVGARDVEERLLLGGGKGRR